MSYLRAKTQQPAPDRGFAGKHTRDTAQHAQRVVDVAGDAVELPAGVGLSFAMDPLRHAGAVVDGISHTKITHSSTRPPVTRKMRT